MDTIEAILYFDNGERVKVILIEREHHCRFIDYTSCNRTESSPGSYGSKAEVLANSELHVEQRDSIDCKHYEVRDQEGGCQRKMI